MKEVGIVTSAKELNYGAILQAYALQKCVSDLGYKPSLLWWNNQKKTHRDIRMRKLLGMGVKCIINPELIVKSVKIYSHAFEKKMSPKSIELYEKFERDNLNIKFMSYAKMKKMANSKICKALIAGSDQIWNSYAVYVDPFYYLRFAPKNKRVAYAPSLGKNDIPNHNKKTMRRYINDFSVLSVRENSGRTLLCELVDKPVEVVLDPSFLLEKKQWKKISSNMDIPEEYILIYFLDQPSRDAIMVIKKVIEKYKKPVLALPYEIPAFYDIDNIKYVDAGPAEFLTLINNAKVVLTDSFHGTAFSINFNIPFLTFEREYGSNQSQSSRITDLLTTFGLLDHFVGNGQVSFETDVNYDVVNDKMKELKNKSKQFLKKAIESCR